MSELKYAGACSACPGQFMLLHMNMRMPAAQVMSGEFMLSVVAGVGIWRKLGVRQFASTAAKCQHRYILSVLTT